MIIKIFSTVSVVLLAWLAMQSSANSQRVAALENSVSTINTSVASTVTEIQQELGQVREQNQEINSGLEGKLDEYVDLQQKNLELGEKTKSEIVAVRKELKNKTAELKTITSLALLKDAYIQTMEAEFLSKAGQSAAAAEKLLSIKSAVWKSSDNFPASKDALRGLMGPIDGLAGAWKGGNKERDTASIRKVLQQVVTKLSAS